MPAYFVLINVSPIKQDTLWQHCFFFKYLDLDFLRYCYCLPLSLRLLSLLVLVVDVLVFESVINIEMEFSRFPKIIKNMDLNLI